MIALQHILVATDFSEPSAVALAYGRDLARAYGATLHLVHIVADVTTPYAIEAGFSNISFLDEMVATATRDLTALVDATDWQDVAVRQAVETRTNVAAGIVDYAHAQPIDLVVVGTHGRSGVAQFFLGSVAERVVRTAPCPVLTVRSHERDFVAVDAVGAPR